MVVALRAVVMLVILVSLPAAWVYYGPLPPSAQRMVDRAVEVAKTSLGWDQPTRPESFAISAPYYEQTSTAAPSGANRTVAAQGSVSERTEEMSKIEPTSTQVESLLEQLRSWGAAEYTLEKWGNNGQLYRFRCAMALTESDELTRQFEAVAADPVGSIEQVVGEVASWQTARLAGQRLQ